MALPAISALQRGRALGLARDAAAARARAGRRARRSPWPLRWTSTPVTSAARNRLPASNSAGERIGGRELRAVEQRQALPWDPARAAAGRARCSASAAGILPPASASISPTPIMAAAMCASGARSPEAPTEPWHGTTGDQVARQHRLEHRARSRAARRKRPARGSRASAPASAARWRSGHGLADARCVRQHDVALQLGQVGRWDAYAGELAEAGVDAVDRLALARRWPRPSARSRRPPRCTRGRG